MICFLWKQCKPWPEFYAGLILEEQNAERRSRIKAGNRSQHSPFVLLKKLNRVLKNGASPGWRNKSLIVALQLRIAKK